MLREGARPAGGRGGAPCRRGGRRACPFKSPAATTVRAKAGGERVRGDRGGGEGAQSPPPRWGRAGREAGRDHCPERGVRGGPVAGVSRGRYHSRGGARATGGTIALRGLRDAAGGGRREGAGRGPGGEWWGEKKRCVGKRGDREGGGAGERGCDGRYHACGEEGGEAPADNGACVCLREGEGPAAAGGRRRAAPSRPGLSPAAAPAPPPAAGGE